jgi:hypothetical protein
VNGAGYEALRRDLKRLRRGPGLTLKRFAEAKALLSALARKARRDGGSEPIQLSLRDAYEMFRQELEDLGEDPWAQATRNAYAIGRERNAGNLTQRRADFAQDHGRSAETIENYENRGIEELATRLADLAIPEEG